MCTHLVLSVLTKPNYMKITKLSLFAFALTLFSTSLSAQNSKAGNWCASDQHLEEMKINDPAFAAAREALEEYTMQFKENYDPSASNKKATVIIPVVVHNITHDGGLGYVSKNVIDQQINRLNIDFNRQNSDAGNTRPIFAPYAAAIDVEFRLAHIDPNGNCTEGIVRMEHPLSHYPVPRDNVKSVSYWPNDGARKYFNIWIIDEIETNPDGSYVAGYAQFPGQNDNGDYGVVICDQNVGFNDRTLTHELGHCLDLYHVFGYGSCNQFSPLYGEDYCDDTPAQYESVTGGCNQNQNTCGFDAFYGADVVDQIENYMSYADCQNMFSLDQKTRVESIFSNMNVNMGMGHLAASSNLIATGVADPYNPPICTPIADFKFGLPGSQLGLEPVYICQGASVDFVDLSYDATPTSWNWIFTGGTPNTSNLEDPTITYNTPGVFSVTHQPETSAGSGSDTKNNIITVSSLTADYSGIVVDGFENATDFNNEWRIENLNDGPQPFSRITTTAATGVASVRIMNRFISVAGEKHELISPSYDLTTLANPTFNFKLAFARRSNSNNDRLLVWYSLDCGSSWTLAMAPMQGSSLATNGGTLNTGVWAPGANDWATKTGSLNSITNETNVRFKFEFTAGGGNNLYLDDINIDGTLSIEDEFKNVAGFNVYPNPTTSSAKISFNLVTDAKNLTIKIRNAVGQVVTNVINGESFEAGKYTLNIDEEKKLSSGLYFIEFNADDKMQVQKLIVR